MRILITGANGFLGHYLSAQLFEKGHEIIATGRGESRLPVNKILNTCPLILATHFQYI